MNAAKYVLKSERELCGLLADRDDLLLMVCRKCFREFDTPEVPEGARLRDLAAGLGKRVTGVLEVDFLCNTARMERLLVREIPEGTHCIVMVSCGVGVQTAAGLTGLPVLAAADTPNPGGHHGMALTDTLCGACGQCYLDITGGICPITACAKGLLNGPCGGAKGGKCEADPKKDCAWQQILLRLEKQGRGRQIPQSGVQLRDHSRVRTQEVRSLAGEARRRHLEGFPGGVHPEEKKRTTEHLPLRPFPGPEIAVLPMGMHIGTPAVPVVQPGDTVQVGQLVGQGRGAVSANVHSSVSGTVIAVEPRPHPNLGSVLSVVIRSDGQDTLHSSVRPGKPLEALTPEEIVQTVRDKGIVGMGGAAFPTHIKLNPGKPIDTVILNGSECEPYLTADHRILLEYAEDVLYGLEAMMKAVGAEQGVILIEDNKPDAIALMEEKTASLEQIRVCAAGTKYPEGAEKMLIRRALGRRVPGGGLPADAGCVVANVSTAKAVSDALQRGMPLVERAVTVTGEYIQRPGNFLVRVGTPVQALLDCCGMTEDGAVLKMGGPMMGTPIGDTRVPILKGSNGVIAVPEEPSVPRTCIRCGRCVDVCPMELEPLNIARLADLGDGEALRAYSVMDCCACRCCEYICAAKLPLLEKLGKAKALVKALGRG